MFAQTLLKTDTTDHGGVCATRSALHLRFLFLLSHTMRDIQLVVLHSSVAGKERLK